ncbi:MAG: type 4a pilus biogenesis protein PilO [Candidatus Shapirobacteria bacterium]|nr:type 4a pilus biogenesis protein PilO [Candidatus Shapirobacteria bacterium]MDD5074085.1 type 4a pilus biogenesis protein PilO [Candidatus Shapirobacteria bacterium]MDD5481419.1 type 4a pilus biogenesis protein PilO [Candidatus Shapirobacteria bacterium]
MINLPKASYRYHLSQIPVPIREKTQKWAPTAAAVFLVAFFVIFAIKPTIATIAELLAEIKAREELNQQLDNKVNQIFAAQNIYSQIYDRLYLLDQTLPVDSQFARFSQTVESGRLEVGLDLSTLNYSSIVLTEKKTAKTPIKENQEFKFSTGLKGYYPNLGTFLENLFNQRRIIYVDSLKISQGKTNQDQKDVSNLPLIITINGRTFYLE